MIARIVASIMTGKLLKDKKERSPKRDMSPKRDTLKKDRKKKDLSEVDAAPARKFPEVLADIEKKSLDF